MIFRLSLCIVLFKISLEFLLNRLEYRQRDLLEQWKVLPCL